jgi:hypothetical protein
MSDITFGVCAYVGGLLSGLLISRAWRAWQQRKHDREIERIGSPGEGEI